MKTLVVVDFQRDFYHPIGSMYVKGAEHAEDAIVNYINEHSAELLDVVFTVDWHSPNHCSFQKNGGPWPVHCVQFSEGAGISTRIMKACIDNNLEFKVFKKGNCVDTEEYGAFQYMWSYDMTNHYKTCNEANQYIFLNCSDLVVCGIAGDYCVKETLNNLLRHNKNEALNLNIEVLKSGIVSIDRGFAIDEFIKENNLKVI